MESQVLRYLHMNNQTPETSSTQITTLQVSGMSCQMCVGHMTRAVEGLSGVVAVEVRLEQEEARVVHLPIWAGEHSLVAAVTDAGYRARVVTPVTAPGQSPVVKPQSRLHQCCGN